MSLASPRVVKALALVVVVLIVLQYTYTTFFESRWIEPLFIFNSSLLAKNHIYVFPGHMINNSDKSNASSSETQVGFRFPFKV